MGESRLHAVLHFCISSIGMMLGNKLAVSALPLPCTLVIIQAIGTLALLVGTRSKMEMIKKDIAIQWLPIAALFTLMLYTSLKSFVYANVSTVIIFRNVGVIFTTIVEYFVRGEVVNVEVAAAELMIVAGAMIYGWSNADFSWVGLFWILFNVAGQVAYGVLVKTQMDRRPHFKDMTKFTMSFYNNMLALPMLLIVLIAQGEHVVMLKKLESVTVSGWAWVVITCVLGFMISTSGFGLQKLVSATTFLVVNNVAKFLNILLGIAFLGDKISSRYDAAGSAVAICASAWYSVAVSRLHHKREAAKTK